MKKINVLILFLLLFFPFLIANGNRLDIMQEVRTGSVIIKKGQPLEQRITIKHNNFSQLRIFANNNKLRNKDNFVFYLKDINTDNQIIREVKFNGMNIGTNYELRLKFDPIINSMEKEYLVVIEKTQNNEESEGEIEFGINDQGLTYKTYYKTSFFGFIQDSLQDFLSRILIDKQFLVIYLIIILICFLFISIF